jgi:hypothetical protein
MKTFKLIERHQQASYAEATQSSKVVFSVATKQGDKFYQEYIPFKCKDYFAELVLTRYLKAIPWEIYGFKCKEIWKGWPYITVASSRLKEKEGIVKYFYLIKDLEKNLSIEPRNQSQIYGSTLANTFIIRLSYIWIYNPTMLSLFTLLVRGLASVNKLNNSTEFKSLQEIIDYLKKSELSDSEIYKSLNTDSFDWLFFLENYKAIFGEDKLTGINDFDLLTLFNVDNYATSLRDKKDLTRTEQWNVSKNHNFTGIYTLSQNIANKWDSGIGKDWVSNYLKLEK